MLDPDRLTTVALAVLGVGGLATIEDDCCPHLCLRAIRSCGRAILVADMSRWAQFAAVFVTFGIGGAALVGILEPGPWLAAGLVALFGSVVALAFLRARHP
jgi:hypothetical protein